MTAPRTTMRNRSGTKLYAVRDQSGRFNDIQSDQCAHAADMRRKSKAEGETAPGVVEQKVRRAAKGAVKPSVRGAVAAVQRAARRAVKQRSNPQPRGQDSEGRMRMTLRVVLGVGGIVLAAHASAQITFYEDDGFRGRAFTTSKQVVNFERIGFNDRASSVVVDRGSWEVCEHAQFGGQCVVLRPGSYDSLAGLGMNDRISSVRPVAPQARYEHEAPPPLPAPTYEYRQRPNERLFQANVTSVRAVVGAPEQRCWVERQQVGEDRQGGANVPGAIVGAVIGGILGHQIGGGRGQDVTTAGGAVAGAVIGSKVGRGGGQGYAQDVQRCDSLPSGARPEFWDVTYNFRGVEHRVQMGAPPGPTITVNAKGEPRG